MEATTPNSSRAKRVSAEHPTQPNVDSHHSKSDSKGKQPKTKAQKLVFVAIVVILVALAVGVSVVWWLSKSEDGNVSSGGRVEFPDPIYSVLTGEGIQDAALNTSPTYCVQIPNGTDGARPQVGLTKAGVVFEAIAEAGITRFAAVFQNADTAVIGPVRSLRPYYLDWDVPFDCTVVHAGGSNEAIAALRQGGHREMDENETYMWRERNTGRLWNNLFTSPADLANYNASKGWTTSNPQGFPRLTPDDVDDKLRERAACADDETCPAATLITHIEMDFSYAKAYNVIYDYDSATNTYLRSYDNGDAHLVYNCPAGLSRPNTKSQCGDLVQVAPSAVVAMVVRESTMSDNYHQKITTIGSGTAYIFQNGEVIEGTWEKSSQNAQIIFKDGEGQVISFTPGQLWVAAVPHYGDVRW